jgi:Rrf2 family protein
MFKLNRKTEYALRGLRYLANQPSDRFIMIKEISQAAEASPIFLGKIFQLLNAAGIVTSSRGVDGGFKLSRDPGEITVKEILEATEGPIWVNQCVVDSRSCKLTQTCIAHDIWIELRSTINKMLDGATLKQIAAGSAHK